MKKVFVMAGLLLLVSCESLHFYTQAISGQLAIISSRRDIQTLLDDPDTNADLRNRLQYILAIRDFAATELALPVADNFSTYVDTGRPFVVWNVFATPEFSMTPEDWCYPVAGCVTYRGYFNEDDARRYAERLIDRDMDVYVGGVAAYSTLGWFSDPVLNTVVYQDDYRLAALIFHELAHQAVYIRGDTEFNESFATTVELEGLKRWLAKEDQSIQAEVLIARATEEKQRRSEFVALVKSLVPALKALYESGLDESAMRAQKNRLIDNLRADYRELKQSWNGYDAYDNWFASDINNPKINTVSTYFDHVPAFTALLAETGHDLPEFYARVAALGKKPRAERTQTLAELAAVSVLESASITTRTIQGKIP